MDLTNKSLPDVIRKDFLTCKVCYELYKSPKLLPCLHSYCLKCLQLMEKNGSLYCPECRLKVNIKGTVSSLPTNFFINSLLEVFTSKHAVDQGCTKCSSSSKVLPAISHCIDCSEYLCNSCTRGHCSVLTRHHKMLDLQDAQNGAHAKGERPPFTCCGEHQEEAAVFFCKTCNCHICRACCQQGHSKHDIVPTTDLEQTAKPDMKRLINDLEMSIGKISERKKEIADELVAFKAADANIRLNISQSVERATAHLQKLQNAYCKTLNLLQKKNLEKYTLLEQELQSQSDRAISTRDFSFKIMEMVKGSDKTCMEDIMRDWVQGLRVCMPKKLELQIPKLIPILGEKEILNIKLFEIQLAEPKPEGSVPTQSSQGIRVPGDSFPPGNCNVEKTGPLPDGPTTVGLSTQSGMSSDCLTAESVFAVSGSRSEEAAAASAQSAEGASEKRASLLAGTDSKCRGTFFDRRRPFYEGWSDESDIFDECRCFDSNCSLNLSYWLDDSFDYSDFSDSSSENENDWVVSREPPPANTDPEKVCSFRVNQSSSSSPPKITAIACFHSGEIIMADSNQDDLKIFSTNGNISECLILPQLRGQPPPCGVAVCGNTLVCSAGCYLIFMSLRGKMRHNVKLRGHQSQYAIASFKSHYVAVSEGTHCSIALYEMSGHCLGRIVPTDYQGGKFLFVAVNSQEVFIVSDFLKKKIVLFHKSGDVLFHKSGDLINVLDASTPLVRDPFCICVADDDHIFVADQGKVLEFTPNGGFGRVVLREDKLSRYPRIITVDSHRRLIVVQRKNHANIIQL